MSNNIDFMHARQVFEEYLDHYDREDDKIRLKSHIPTVWLTAAGRLRSAWDFPKKMWNLP